MPESTATTGAPLDLGDAAVGVRDRTINAAVWAAGAQVIQQVAHFAAAVVLTRLLAPRDYGLLGMVLVFTGFAALLKELNGASALVQRPSLEDRHVVSSYWFGLAVSLVLALALVGAAPLIAGFYSEPRLVGVTAVLAINFPLIQLGSIQRALLQRDLQHRKMAVADVIGMAVGSAVAVGLAVAGAGVWALVLQIVVTSAVTSAVIWQMSSWRPSLLFDVSAIRELFGFTASLLGGNLVIYSTRSLDNLLVGRFLDSAALGVYTRAYSLMMLPLTQLSAVLGKVMFPSLSLLQGDPARVKRAYLRTIAIIALVTAPLMIGLAVVADDLVHVAFGERWSGMVPVLQILAVLGFGQSVGTTVGWIYLSQGRADLQLKWAFAAGPIVLVAIGIGVAQGTVVAVAAAYAITTGIVLMYPGIAIPGRLIGMSFLDFMRAIAAPAAGALLMSGAIFGVELLLPDGLPRALRLVVLVTVGAITYGSYILLTRPAPYRDVRDIVEARLARRRGGAPSAATGTS